MMRYDFSMTLQTTVDVQKDFYVIDGKEYPRMTRVLDVIAKPEFYRWYAKNGYEKCQATINDRAAFGTRCHAEFEHILRGDKVWYDNPEMEATIRRFDKWRKNNAVEPFIRNGEPTLEVRMHSDELGVAGTGDFVGWYNGKRMLLDWKTSRAVYDNYLLQVSGYMYMYEQMYDERLDGAGVVAFRVDNAGKVAVRSKYISRDEALKHLEVFRAVVKVYNWKFKKGRWSRGETTKK